MWHTNQGRQETALSFFCLVYPAPPRNKSTPFKQWRKIIWSCFLLTRVNKKTPNGSACQSHPDEMFSFLKGNNSIVWGFGLVLHVKGVESAVVFLWHGETMTHWLQNCVQGCVCVIDPIDLLGAFFYFLSCSGRKIYPMVEKNLPVMFKQSNKSSFSPSKCPFKLPGWEFDAKVFYIFNNDFFRRVFRLKGRQAAKISIKCLANSQRT